MPKTILAIATAFLAVMTVFASAAEAGPRGGRGYGGSMGIGPTFGASSKSYSPKRSYRLRRLAKRKALAARKARAAAIARAKAKARAKALAAAKAAAAREAEVAKVNDMENSTIFVDEVAEAETDESEEVAALEEELSCKKFVPEVGMTVTVPCE